MGKESLPGVQSAESKIVDSWVKTRNQEAKGKGQTESLYVSLAHLFSQEGRQGLIRLSAEFRDISKCSVGKNQLLSKWHRAVISARASVLFGISIREIEQAMVDKAFDSRNYATSCNKALANTGIEFTREIEASTPQLTSIPKEKWKKMIKLSKKDPTLAIFFRKKGGFYILPEILQFDIGGVDTFRAIQTDILPIYASLAKDITPPDFDLARYPSLGAQKAV